ncbi:MAG: Ppx/GppA family phosphatase [Rhodospirillaceae bacterium]|nr:Ppx/GppA family phosphatase [Rhodospirillaceae bacterium]
MAALDLGTNNCRLLIARQGNNGFQVIDAFSRIVRLGEGVSQSGALSDAAMDRTIEALKVCSAKIQRRSVSLVRSVATRPAARANGLEFLERTRAETGVDLEIITTSEEAKLAFSGCMPLLDRARPYAIVFDIGGGSTELGWIHLEHGRHPRIIAWHSIPLGVVTLTERFGAEAAPDESAAEFYERMVAEVQDNLAPFAQAIGAHRLIARSQVQLLGTSGTVTTLSGIQMGLPRYDRSVVDGSFLEFGDVERISKRLSEQNCGERATNPCIGSERSDLVVSGCAVLSAICRQWPIGRLRVADRGVREGILMSLMTGTAPDNVYRRGLNGTQL